MKKTEKKKMMSRIFSVLLAGGLIAGSCVCSWAVGGDENGGAEKATTGSTVALTKNYMVPEGVKLQSANFEFEYTSDGVVSGETGYSCTLVSDSTQPDLTALDSENDVSFTGSETKKGTVDGKDVYVKTVSNVVPAASNFSHAGEYVYTISETEDTNSSIDADMSYSGAEYKLHVFVKNGSSGLEIAGAAVYQAKDNSGEDGSGAKVNLDKSTLLDGTLANGYGNDFEFTNLYTPDEALSISKSVSGDYADLTKSFTMSVTLTNPTTSTNSEYSAVIVDTATNKPVDAKLESFTPGTATDISLTTGQELVFVNKDTELSTDTAISSDDSVCVPAGLTYSIVETGQTDYTHSAVVTSGGTNKGSTSANSGEALTVDKDTLVNVGTNNTSLTSTYHTITVTGVIIRLLPAVLMMIIVALGIMIGVKTDKRV